MDLKIEFIKYEFISERDMIIIFFLIKMALGNTLDL